MNTPKLGERAILMRLSAGVPGKQRKDRALTVEVKNEKHLGQKSGAWVKNRWPDWALEPIEKVITEARQYHAAVTLPFDAGIGILPAALIMEHGDRMRQFKGRFENLVQSHFRVKYPEMIDWARGEHNGTFDASDYPDVDEVLESFYFRTEPLPVPDAGHFTATMSSLLGTDTESVDLRVKDTMVQAQQELLRRMIEPVRAMAERLGQAPTVKADGTEKDVIFRDSLVGNLQEIARLVPKLNLGGVPEIDAFAKEIEGLTLYSPKVLRESKSTRAEVHAKAAELFKRLDGYKI